MTTWKTKFNEDLISDYEPPKHYNITKIIHFELDRREQERQKKISLWMTSLALLGWFVLVLYGAVSMGAELSGAELISTFIMYTIFTGLIGLWLGMWTFILWEDA